MLRRISYSTSRRPRLPLRSGQSIVLSRVVVSFSQPAESRREISCIKIQCIYVSMVGALQGGHHGPIRPQVHFPAGCFHLSGGRVNASGSPEPTDDSCRSNSGRVGRRTHVHGCADLPGRVRPPAVSGINRGTGAADDRHRLHRQHVCLSRLGCKGNQK